MRESIPMPQAQRSSLGSWRKDEKENGVCCMDFLKKQRANVEKKRKSRFVPGNRNLSAD